VTFFDSDSGVVANVIICKKKRSSVSAFFIGILICKRQETAGSEKTETNNTFAGLNNTKLMK
jgi:hypothetical protein